MVRKKARTGIDPTRLAEAMKRPGIDSRSWVSLAVVTDFAVDPDHGVYADIVLVPDGDEYTARVGPIYSGSGFGLYAPLKVDDEVLVVCPSGHPDEGWVIVSRMWSAADKPPTVPTDEVEDLLLVMEENKTARIVVSGSGNILLKVADGKVQLVSADNAEKMVMGETLQSALSSLLQTLITHTHTCAVGPTSPPIPPALTDLTALKVSPVDNGLMLSDHATIAK